MKAVMISVKPRWCEKIMGGEKTVEIRSSRPKLDPPFRVYIYMSKGHASYPITINGNVAIRRIRGGRKVIAEFICDRIAPVYGHVRSQSVLDADCPGTCMSADEFNSYGDGRQLFAWNISGLKSFEQIKELSEFTAVTQTRFGGMPHGMQKPPQSWGYVEELE